MTWLTNRTTMRQEAPYPDMLLNLVNTLGTEVDQRTSFRGELNP